MSFDTAILNSGAVTPERKVVKDSQQDFHDNKEGADGMLKIHSQIEELASKLYPFLLSNEDEANYSAIGQECESNYVALAEEGSNASNCYGSNVSDEFSDYASKSYPLAVCDDFEQDFITDDNEPVEVETLHLKNGISTDLTNRKSNLTTVHEEISDYVGKLRPYSLSYQAWEREPFSMDTGIYLQSLSPLEMSHNSDPFSATFDDILDQEEQTILSSPESLSLYATFSLDTLFVEDTATSPFSIPGNHPEMTDGIENGLHNESYNALDVSKEEINKIEDQSDNSDVKIIISPQIEDKIFPVECSESQVDWRKLLTNGNNGITASLESETVKLDETIAKDKTPYDHYNMSQKLVDVRLCEPNTSTKLEDDKSPNNNSLSYEEVSQNVGVCDSSHDQSDELVDIPQIPQTLYVQSAGSCSITANRNATITESKDHHVNIITQTTERNPEIAQNFVMHAVSSLQDDISSGKPQFASMKGNTEDVIQTFARSYRETFNQKKAMFESNASISAGRAQNLNCSITEHLTSGRATAIEEGASECHSKSTGIFEEIMHSVLSEGKPVPVKKKSVSDMETRSPTENLKGPTERLQKFSRKVESTPQTPLVEKKDTSPLLPKVFWLNSSKFRPRTEQFTHRCIAPPVPPLPNEFRVLKTSFFTVEKPSDADFVLPPLPPPPSEEDLHSIQNNAPFSDMTTSSARSSQSSQDSNSVLSPKFKASSSYSIWTSSNKESVQSNSVKINSPSSKSWLPPGKTTISAGYRSVALPTSKKPANGSSKGVSSSSETISLPVDQLPPASENVRVTSKDKLPDGAVYETQTKDGDVIHTDTYYPAPAGERMVLERTKTTTIVKAPRHDGMGPTDDKGVPVALRTTVGNPKAWYKNMFKQIHQQNDEDNITEEKHEDGHHLENKATHKGNDNRLRRVGKITEYTPSQPYVVENEPQTKNKIPAASTSMTDKQDMNKSTYKRPELQQSSVAGTDKNSKSSYIMAEYVKAEPKKTTVAASQNKPRVKSQEMRKAAKVKFDFVGSSDKQLTILKNQTIVVTRQVNNDWFEGESVDGKRTGIFPVAYVEILSESPMKPVRSGSAKAKFNFTGKDPKQLTIKKGDTVELLERVDKNWYKGRMGTVTGILPVNYLEIIREPEQTQKTSSRSEPPPMTKTSNNNIAHKQTPSSSSDASSEADDKDKMTKASFLAQAAVSSGGTHLSAPKFRRGEFDIPELEDEAMGIPSPKSNSDHTPQGSTDTTLSDLSSSVHSHTGSSHTFGKDTKENDDILPLEQSDENPLFQTQRHITLYPFAPQNEDELELLAGDVVHVVEQCDDGWFVGTCERTNAFGTFPGNYVVTAD